MAPPPPFLPISLSLLLLLLLFPSLPSSLSPPTHTTISPTKSPSSPSPTKSPSSPSPTKSPSSPSPSSSPSPTTSPPPSSKSSPTSTTLDPKQLTALQSLNIPTSKDPCSPPHTTALCDNSSPFRHLLSLSLSNCSLSLHLSTTALTSLSTLTSLHFQNCPSLPTPLHLPPSLASNLRSFSAVDSFKTLTGVFLSRLHNLTDLTLSAVPVTASGPGIILYNMKNLKSLTISQANLTGYLPRHWHYYTNLSHVDFSINKLEGKIPSSLTLLENLLVLNLSSNRLSGEIPSSIGDLLSLQNLSISANSFSGSIPDSLAAISSLVHLDLGRNRLNGSIPKFIADMKELRYLNLEKNDFHGIMPFNASFIERLAVFKIGGNANLCYNHSTLSPKVKLGIAPCDRHGLPLSPPPAKDASGPSSDDGVSSDDDYSEGDETGSSKKHHTHGPSKVVLGVAIGLSSVVFLIIFLVLISKCCR
ncbi:hypothetical protein RHSIM_Rhsim13G0188600 [Rhododendron simsii]|uniref:Receptor-like protein 51 n=1 Tax=Rhododendron simsii TaxID=118357 RepID=A0A834L7U0_RHOSS|nr:hypothetical protein RHSIM_Rhsim13G0188600 [Rhododendron simsii]